MAKIYKCPECDYVSKYNCWLKKHMLSHLDEKKFKCDICLKLFKRMGTLKRHVIVHTNVMNFKCHKCSKLFKTKDSLRQHLTTTHSNMRKYICDQPNCSYSGKRNGDLTTHKWQVHTIGNGKYYPCNMCEYKPKSKSDLNKHLLQKHNIGIKKMYSCNICKFTCKVSNHYNRHMWVAHDIGNGKIYKCETCPFQTKDKCDHKRHRWDVHDLGNGSLYYCNECTHKTKSKCSLKTHILNKHEFENKTILYCTQNDCYFKTKYKGVLTQHLWCLHDIGKQEIFKCTECSHTSKIKGNIKSHMWKIHDIGTGELFKCSVCEYTCKAKGDIKEHEWTVHNKGNGKYFKCIVKGCKQIFKKNSRLTVHMSHVHDIGKYQCQYCIKNVFKLNNYKDPITNTTSKICRKCYNKATGFTTSKEKQMVEHLKKNEQIEPYIVLEDRILKHNKCNTKRRPDLLISEPNNLHFIVECSENQHKHYNPSCESGRIDELADEFTNGRIIVIHWNPDTYKVEKGTKLKTRQKRLKQLENLILELSNKKWTINDDYIQVHYMYYDPDNPTITNRFKKHFH
jgi:hypothetical protein